MIIESDVKYIISNEMPDLAIDLSMIKQDDDLYQVMECLTAYTKDAIRSAKVDAIRSSFYTAYELLHQGSNIVRYAVMNIYINSVSRLFECSSSIPENIRLDFMKVFSKEYQQLVYQKAI